MPVRDRTDTTVAPWRPPLAPHHVRRSPGFINKYELIEIEQERVVTSLQEVL
jgi:hypothetical protein